MSRLPLSDSRLRNAGCLFLFFNLYVRKPKVLVPKTTPMMFGGLFHEIMHRWYVNLGSPDGNIDKVALMQEVFKEAWADRLTGEFAGLSDDWHDDLLNLCLDTAKETMVGPDFVGSEIRVAVNQDWEPVDWMAKDVFYRGIMDRVDAKAGALLIRDYKTSWQAASEDQVKRDPQLRGYAMLGKAYLPEVGRIDVSLDFVRTGVVRTVSISDHEITQAKARLLRESDRIEAARKADAWPATPGSLCEFCPVYDKCPAKTEATALRPPENEEQADQLLGLWALRKRDLDIITSQLQAWVRNYGDLRANGLHAAYHTYQTTTYDTDALILRFKELGIDPVKYFKTDNEGLKRLAAKKPEVEAALAPIRTEDGFSKWGVAKDKGDE